LALIPGGSRANRKLRKAGRGRATMNFPRETEAGSAGRQSCRGINQAGSSSECSAAREPILSRCRSSYSRWEHRKSTAWTNFFDFRSWSSISIPRAVSPESGAPVPEAPGPAPSRTNYGPPESAPTYNTGPHGRRLLAFHSGERRAASPSQPLMNNLTGNIAASSPPLLRPAGKRA
jgi:hypothetical protein